MNIQEFRNRMKTRKANSASFLNWKKDGSLLFVVHPKASIGERSFVRYERVVTNEDGKTAIWGARREFEGDNDFSLVFKEWLNNEDSIENDDVVFKLESSESGSKEYLKGDLLGFSQDPNLAKKYSWQKNMLNKKSEFLLCARPYKKWEEGWQVLALTPGAGEKWWKVVESQIEEFGEEEGSYVENPMVFKISFDSSAAPANMYSVEQINHKITDEHMPAFDEDPIDIDALCTSEAYNPEGGDAKDLVKAMIQVPCPLFEGVEREDVPVDSKPITSSSNNGLNKGDKFTYDDEVVEYVKTKGDVLIFKDEDGLKIKVDVADKSELLPFEETKNDDPVEQFAEETMSTDTGVQVKDCEKGKEYYTFDGEVLTFVKFLKTKNKGKFKDFEENKVEIDGNEYVSPGEDNGDDPLEDLTEKVVDSPKDMNIEKEVDKNNSEEDICGTCGNSVTSDATECPECGTVFGIDDDDLPSFEL